MQEALIEICKEKTWVMPAHDRSLSNFKGESINIDLGSSQLAAGIAQALYMLGDRLDAQTRAMVLENLHRRILKPFDDMAAERRKGDWWMRTTNNWNSVCLASITCTALAAVESPVERARVILSAAKYSHNFLNGFTPDGYCSEGVGYWNYGFGNYTLLVEAVLQATGGKVDLLLRDGAQSAARYGGRIEITEGVSPAFADCGVNSRPSASLMWYVNRRQSWNEAVRRPSALSGVGAP